MSAGGFLADARLRLGVSLAEASWLAECSPDHLRRVERGQRVASHALGSRLAWRYGLLAGSR